MLKQLLAFLLVLNFLTVQSYGATQTGLKNVFDEFHYAMSVEWDQKDQDFKKVQMQKLQASLMDLQAKGLTNSQLLDFAKSQMKSQQAAKDLETAFTMVSINKMSAAEASKYVMESMNRSYTSGANWSGDTWISIGFAAFIVVAVVVFVNVGERAPEATGGGTYTCEDTKMCDRYCEPAWEGSYIESCWYDCYYVCI